MNIFNSNLDCKILKASTVKTKFRYLVALFFMSISAHAWSACITQVDSSIVATANGDSCTNSSIINTATDSAFGIDAGSLTSVTLTNSSSGSITTTGNGAAGIHATGEGAVILNSGSISVSGVYSSGNYADGINALGNNSQVINTGSISVFGDAMFGVWFRGSTGGIFNNSGSISASGIGGLGVALGAATESFTNSGTIQVTGINSVAVASSGDVKTFVNSGQITSAQSDAVSLFNVDTFTNTGSIQAAAGFYGLNIAGAITTLNNAQGGNGSTASTTALTYTGNLPANYNIIINSPTHFGQLAVSSPLGATTFGIYGSSNLSKGTFSAVLSGITSANLTGATSGNFNGFTWTLNNSSANIWDLIVLGASTVDTQASLVNTASALQNIYTLQNSVLANSFSYDCALFDVNNICISAGGRNTAVSAANGLNNTSGLLIAAYRPHSNYRVGAYFDQNLSMNNAGSTVNLGNNTPLVGLFGVWNERLDGTGAEVKVSAAYGQKNATVTRQVVGTSEAGSGSAALNSQGAQVLARYGFGVVENIIVNPYAGIRYTQNNMGGYTEGASSAVTAPLTYSALNTNATTALAGVGASYRFTPQAVAFASAGVESDTNTANGNYSATGVVGLTPINFNANPVKTRPTASVGAYYDIIKNQRLGITGIYRQEPYQAVQTTTVMATYTVGL